ncbi:aromatic amino acid transaminase [Castellaniella sp.]|uniref:amino acid aminotransferase n=1 Tax=Castellaniella sp. TaxID=1955812 RepID=UPI003C78E11D
MFAHIPPFAGDPIFELGNACRRDPRADKVNLTVGLYYDEDGRIPVLQCVQQAEARLAQQARPRTYLPIEGLEPYRLAVQRLVFGADSPALRDQRVATIQSVGGTGALKVGADFLHAAYPDSAVWISDPAWDNHFAIFSGAGIATHRYPYYDPATHGVRFDAMMDTLAALPARSIVLLHPCCHNPSGADLTADQWRDLIALMQRQNLIPFLDLAYQGFGSGLDEDALAVRLLAESGMAYLTANSFSKNFSFYGERCGGLSVVCEQAAHVPSVLGQLVAIVRRIYSNPPVHGAQVIAQVLGDPALNRLWQDEVTAMRARIQSMRSQAVEQLARKAPDYPARYLLAHQGMFSLTGLRPEQILMLRERHAVYLLDSGRICLPGLNTRNVGLFTDALADVLARTASAAHA